MSYTPPSDPNLVLQHYSPEQVKALYAKAAESLWRQGHLRYLLHATQLKILSALEASKERSFFVLCSRRLGKSFMLVTLAFEQALSKPGSRILYLAPWQKDAADIANDLAAQILKECPLDLQPVFSSQSKEFHFKNGSIIRLKGTNGEHAQFLRGTAADLIILDECALMTDLNDVVNSVCLPMVMTTGGRIILATTPPKSPEHDSKPIFDRLFGLGATAEFTIRDAPHVTDDVKVEFLVAAGEVPLHARLCIAGLASPKTTTALREYWCAWVTDADSRVVPEWTEEAAKELVRTQHWNGYADTYTAMDPGFADRTGLLFAHYDFDTGNIIIEDEALLHKASTWDIATAIQGKEHELWGTNRPFMRVSDVDPRLLADLYQRHGLVFVAAQKQDSLGAVNLVRNMIQAREIVVNPKCVNLIRQLENTVWNTKATDFARDNHGHGDLLAALKYLCRHISRRRRPDGGPVWGLRGKTPTRGPDTFVSPKQSRKMRGIETGFLPDTAFSRKLTGKGRRRG